MCIQTYYTHIYKQDWLISNTTLCVLALAVLSGHFMIVLHSLVAFSRLKNATTSFAPLLTDLKVNFVSFWQLSDRGIRWILTDLAAIRCVLFMWLPGFWFTTFLSGVGSLASVKFHTCPVVRKYHDVTCWVWGICLAVTAGFRWITSFLLNRCWIRNCKVLICIKLKDRSYESHRKA